MNEASDTLPTEAAQYALYITDESRAKAVGLRYDGSVEFRGVTPDEASRLFWDSMGREMIVRAAVLARAAVPAVQPTSKLWLWKNFVGGRPEYWAFDNPYPTHLDNGDPQTLGQPCGYAIFKPSRDGSCGRTEDQVLREMASVASRVAPQAPAVQPDLRAMLVKARAGLSNGLWDYGPGQDEHDQCDALIAEIDAALSSTPAQGDGGTGGVQESSNG